MLVHEKTELRAQAARAAAPCDHETGLGGDAASRGMGLRPEVSKSHIFSVPASPEAHLDLCEVSGSALRQRVTVT